MRNVCILIFSTAMFSIFLAANILWITNARKNFLELQDIKNDVIHIVAMENVTKKQFANKDDNYIKNVIEKIPLLEKEKNIMTSNANNSELLLPNPLKEKLTKNTTIHNLSFSIIEENENSSYKEKIFKLVRPEFVSSFDIENILSLVEGRDNRQQIDERPLLVITKLSIKNKKLSLNENNVLMIKDMEILQRVYNCSS